MLSARSARLLTPFTIASAILIPNVSAIIFVESCPDNWVQIGDYCYSPGKIAGMVIGGIIGLVIVISLIVYGSTYLCCRERLKKNRPGRNGILPEKVQNNPNNNMVYFDPNTNQNHQMYMAPGYPTQQQQPIPQQSQQQQQQQPWVTPQQPLPQQPWVTPQQNYQPPTYPQPAVNKDLPSV